MRRRLKDTIKDIMQSTEHPIVFASAGNERRQTLYLCQYKEETMLEGQAIHQGTYLLTNEKTIQILDKYNIIQKVSDESITAFVLPYIEGRMGERILDDSADIVVTPRLTGCTVAAELNSESPRLLHVNLLQDDILEGPDGLSRPVLVIDQPGIDRDIEERMEGVDYFSIKKEEYTLTEGDEMRHSATFIGFKEARGWSYLTQITEYNTDSEIYSVHPGKQFTPYTTWLITNVTASSRR